LVLAGTEPRLASSGIVETASERILEQTGERPHRPSALAQLIDLAFPFTLHEQGPLLARGIPALTLTTGGERPPSAFFDRPSRLDANRLGELGRAAQPLLSWLDSGVWPSAPSVPLPPDSPPASSWPVFGLLGLALLGGIGWFVTRERLLPRRPVSPSEELAGTAAALLALGVVSLLVVATNPFALI